MTMLLFVLAQVHAAAAAPAPAPTARNLVPEWMNDPVVTFVADRRGARLFRVQQSPEECIWENKGRYSVDYVRPSLCPAPCKGTLATNAVYGVSGPGVTRSALFTVPEGEHVEVRAKVGSSTSFAVGLTAALIGATAIIPGAGLTIAGGDTLVPGVITLGAGLALLPIGIYLAGKGLTHVTVRAERTTRGDRPAIKTDAKPEARDVLLIFPRIESSDALAMDEGRTLRLALSPTPTSMVNQTPTGRVLGRVRTRDIDIPSMETQRNLRCGFGREWNTVDEEMPKSYKLPAFCDDQQDPAVCRESTTPLVDTALDELRTATATAGGWVATDIQCWTGKNASGAARLWCEATAEGN